jgi:hypothetical protein
MRQRANRYPASLRALSTWHWGGGDRPRGARPVMVIALAVLVIGMGLCAAGCAPPSRVVSAQETRIPRGTPTATPTARDALILRALGDQAQAVTTTSDAKTGALVVTISITGRVPSTDADIAGAQERVKLLCYRALNALLTSGVAGEVTIVVLGPMLDEYANLITGNYGSAIVEPRTGARLDWPQLTPDSAWPLYDHVFLCDRFYPVY